MSDANPDERLIYMANQIARNLLAEGEDKAVAATADHIQKFWDPRMRSRIMAVFASGGAGLDEITSKALQKLAGP
jgi:formate dehydrogenase subunit delta